ncbi:hypothetical protein [Botrimarina hoheduenensis]|uniref:Uncharacterized protein n=1 Tax=Botrimarina hoheduenensis TaxID=2528000 RepID=A0A5C5WAW7_9BACT|nr:hypothetical protein [Botrimarina hoheduenensis]TWT47734.1 hypothetical protein Pla111_13540 [Botrimarina hoheduenensis]
MRSYFRLLLLALAPLVVLTTGCHIVVPEVSHQALLHNPFPQLSRVAVTPFFNQSEEPTVDGRQFARAYFSELQTIPGYEVVPVGVVETAMREMGIVNLDDPAKVRALGEALGVDAVVVGAVTEFSPYYPPRCGLRVSWYASNPGFHEIPAGYGLPWGTAMEEYIPPKVVFEAEMALARAQLETQSPTVGGLPQVVTPTDQAPLSEPLPFPLEATQPLEADPFEGSGEPAESLPAPQDAIDARDAGAEATSYAANDAIGPTGSSVATDATGAFPPEWPDASGFTPPGPSAVRPQASPNFGPVMTQTQVYHGADAEFTAALADYVGFRDDARTGGWQSYLSRSDDFIRFCCHRHLSEMLIARGGGGETRVVSRWPRGR